MVVAAARTVEPLFVWALRAVDNEKQVYIGKRAFGEHSGLWSPPSAELPSNTDSGSIVRRGCAVLGRIANVTVEPEEVENISKWGSSESVDILV